jgi:hypothetical protein
VENKNKKQNNMASATIAKRTTSISFPFGDDASEFYIGFHLYENENYDSLSIYKILNELKKLSMDYKTTTNTGQKIRLVNNVNGIKFELVSWVQGKAGINYEILENAYNDGFIKIQEVLLGVTTEI